MNNHPTPTEPQTEAEQRARDAQYYRRILLGLIDMGNDIAGMIHKQAEAQAAAAAPDAAPSLVPSPETRRAFDDITRTVRRCIWLAKKVSAPEKVQPAAVSPEQRRTAARKKVIRLVDNSIHREAAGDEAESLRAELAERLDAPEFEDDLDRPVAEVVAEIQADMGLLGDEGRALWPRRTPADVAALHARAAAPARPRGGAWNLPVPPRGWVDHGGDGAAGCRGGP